MHAVLRPYVTAGVSLIGASAIAISPISPIPAALPDIHVPARAVSSAAVQLVVSPIDFYTGLFVRTTTNIGQLAGNFLGDPAPVLAQVVANQIANGEAFLEAVRQGADSLVFAVAELIPQQLHAASVALANGDVETALNALLEIPNYLAFPLIDSVYDAVITPILLAVNRINNIVQNAGTIVFASAISIMGPVISTIGAVGSAVQGVIDAAGTGDIAQVVGAVVNAPGIVADGFLNGGYGPLMLGYIPAPGILDSMTGPIAALLGIRQVIAQGLGAEPPQYAIEEVQRSAADEEVGAVAFDTQKVSLESGPSEAQVDPAAQDTGADSGTGDTAGGPDLPKGDAAESTVKPGGGTDLSKGNKVVPGKLATKPGQQGAGPQEVASGTTAGTATEPIAKDDGADESGDKGSGAGAGDKAGGDNKAGDADS